LATEYKVTSEQLTGIADKIRNKANKSDRLSFPDAFEEAIDSIQGIDDLINNTFSGALSGNYSYIKSGTFMGC